MSITIELNGRTILYMPFDLTEDERNELAGEVATLHSVDKKTLDIFWD